MLTVDVSGQAGVPVTLELAFTGEGRLSGVTPLAELPAPRRDGSWLQRGGAGQPDTRDAFVLREGWGRFSVGDDRIEFGEAEIKAWAVAEALDRGAEGARKRDRETMMTSMRVAEAILGLDFMSP